MGNSFFKPGTLWDMVVARSNRAIDQGTLENIPTNIEVIKDQGLRFQIHLVDSIRRKRIAKVMQGATGTNPFLPYEEDMYVADISNTHVCLLNKFNVLTHHILIVTRKFEHQESLLTARDFSATWKCLREFFGLAFYNSGTIAGASQPHKHFQQVPLPLGGLPNQLILDQLITSAELGEAIGSVEELPWQNLVASLTFCDRLDPDEAGRETSRIYEEMLAAVDISDLTQPYNLLVTNDWMMLVPRTVESFATISVNALGFAGSLLVRNEEELDLVRKAGPMNILKQVGVSV
ncbi:MAG: phosphorylase [Myxococcota bacterium]|nr:phosphorylase [Myxococcota bacterium]